MFRSGIRRMLSVVSILMVLLFGLSEEARAVGSPLRNGTEEIVSSDSVSVVSLEEPSVSARGSSLGRSLGLDGEMVAFLDGRSDPIHHQDHDAFDHSLTLPSRPDSGTLYAQGVTAPPPDPVLSQPDLDMNDDSGFRNSDFITNGGLTNGVLDRTITLSGTASISDTLFLRFFLFFNAADPQMPIRQDATLGTVAQSRGVTLPSGRESAFGINFSFASPALFETMRYPSGRPLPNGRYEFFFVNGVLQDDGSRLATRVSRVTRFIIYDSASAFEVDAVDAAFPPVAGRPFTFTVTENGGSGLYRFGFTSVSSRAMCSSTNTSLTFTRITGLLNGPNTPILNADGVLTNSQTTSAPITVNVPGGAGGRFLCFRVEDRAGNIGFYSATALRVNSLVGMITQPFLDVNDNSGFSNSDFITNGGLTNGVLDRTITLSGTTTITDTLFLSFISSPGFTNVRTVSPSQNVVGSPGTEVDFSFELSFETAVVLSGQGIETTTIRLPNNIYGFFFASSGGSTSASRLDILYDSDSDFMVSATADSPQAGAPFTFTVIESGGSGLTTNFSFTSVSDTAMCSSTNTSLTFTFITGLTNGPHTPIMVSGEVVNSQTTSGSITIDVPSNAGRFLCFRLEDVAGNFGFHTVEVTPLVSISSTAVMSSVTEGMPIQFTVSLTVSQSTTTDIMFTLECPPDNAFPSLNPTLDCNGDATSDIGTLVRGTNSNTYTLTLPANSTMATITQPTNDDNLSEGPEEVTLTLESPNTGIFDIPALTRTSTVTITDNDELTVSIANTDVTEGDPAMLTVTLMGGIPTGDVTVTYATSDAAPSSATEGDDYIAVPDGSVTITAGMTTGMFEVLTIEDTVPEGNETFTVTLNAATGGAPGVDRVILGSNVATVTIIDDEDILVSFTTAEMSVIEADTNVSLMVPVRLTIAASENVTVDYSITGTATLGSDYTVTGGSSITISTGSTAANIPITIIGDNFSESAETLILTLMNVSDNAALGASPSVTIAIQDDDDITVSIANTDVSVTEGDPAMFTVTLTETPTAPVTVMYATANGTATSTEDYTAQMDVLLTIPADMTSGTISVPITNDNLSEGNETFNLEITGASGGGGAITLDPTLATTPATATIAASDPITINVTATTPAVAPTLISEVTEGEEVVFTVSLTTSEDNSREDMAVIPTTNVTLDLTVTCPDTNIDDTIDCTVPSYSNGFAGPMEEFPDTLSAGDMVTVVGQLTIPMNVSSGTISVSTVNDTLSEGEETISLTLSSPTGGGGGERSPTIASGSETTTINITDDDDLTVSIANINVNEGEDAMFTVTLTNIPTEDVTVMYETSDDTATSPADYTAQTDVLTIPAGMATGTIEVPTIDDTVSEENEEFIMTLTGATGGDPGPVDRVILGSNVATATIIDNEGILVSFTTAEMSVIEADTNVSLMVPVRLTIAASENVTVDYSITGTATLGSDYTVTGGSSITISTGSTAANIPITIIGDNFSESAETLILTLTSVSADVSLGAPLSVTITIQDDDDITVSVADTSANEDDLEAVFTVTLTGGMSTEDVTVMYATTDVDATSPQDYTARTDVLTIPTGMTTGTISVVIANDNLSEGAETFILRLISVSGGGGTTTLDPTLATTPATATIAASDPIMVSIADTSANEDDLEAEFTVTLTGGIPKSEDVTVMYETSNTSPPSAIAVLDYTARTDVLTIPTGMTTGTISVVIANDNRSEGAETFTLTLSEPGAGSGLVLGGGGMTTLDTTPATATIEASDPITVSVADTSANEDDLEAVFTVTLTGGMSTEDVTVMYATTDVDATSPQDYTARTDVLTIPTGMTTGTISVVIANDNLSEGAETFILRLISVSGGGGTTTLDPTLATTPATATIAASDPIMVSIADTSANEDDLEAEFTVTLTGGIPTEDVTVMYETSNTSPPSAIAVLDYTARTDVLTIPTGMTTGTISVVIANDNRSEGAETFTLTLSEPWCRFRVSVRGWGNNHTRYYSRYRDHRSLRPDHGVNRRYQSR